MALGDATHAAVVYDRLAPYAGRPATAGRAVASYGAADRHLGGLAALLGRRDDAVRHLRAAIARNDELGCTVWRLHAQWWLQRIAPEDPLPPRRPRPRTRSDSPRRRRGSGEDGRRLEALDDEVDAQRQLPEELRDRRDALDRAAGSMAPNRTATPEAQISGPPTRPSTAMPRGTSPERDIR